MSYLSGHGVNPVTPTWDEMGAVAGYEEELGSVDPIAAELTYRVDGDALTLTVDADLNVVGVTEGSSAE